MRANEFVTEAIIAQLKLGSIVVAVDDHAIEQVYFREIDPKQVDSLLRKLPGFEDQLMSMAPGQKFWVTDPDTQITIGLRRDSANSFQFKTAVQPLTYQSDVPEIVLGQEQLAELSFLGSECTKDCSGHRAGYNWSKRKGLRQGNSPYSPSFNKGAALAVAGY
jgi:hypothetical protein